MSKQKLGDLIQLRRTILSLKQEDLAELSGVTIKTVYLIESGTGNPSLNTLEKILDVLGMELSFHLKNKVL